LNSKESDIRKQVLAALEHPEAEEGLYLGNFHVLHEEDERPRVDASEEEILEVLQELVNEGVVGALQDGEDVIFRLTEK
jgi:hypothetical protein